MITLTIKRIAESLDGTFGVLIYHKNNKAVPFAVTLEREWLGNKPNESCVPSGGYICKRRPYYSGGYDTFEVTNVPNRSNILIHKGNTEDDSKGCILVAEQFGHLNDKTAVLASRKGFNEFMALLKGVNEFKLQIQDCTF